MRGRVGVEMNTYLKILINLNSIGVWSILLVRGLRTLSNQYFSDFLLVMYPFLSYNLVVSRKCTLKTLYVNAFKVKLFQKTIIPMRN